MCLASAVSVWCLVGPSQITKAAAAAAAVAAAAAPVGRGDKGARGSGCTNVFLHARLAQTCVCITKRSASRHLPRPCDYGCSSKLLGQRRTPAMVGGKGVVLCSLVTMTRMCVPFCCRYIGIVTDAVWACEAEIATLMLQVWLLANRMPFAKSDCCALLGVKHTAFAVRFHVGDGRLSVMFRCRP